MLPTEEFSLIQQCKAQDRKAQNCLYRQYYSDFLKICLRYAGSQMDAEQWMNDAFYKIFTRIHQYRHEGPFEGWMKRILIHTCLDNLRSAMHKQGNRFLEIDEATAGRIVQTDAGDAIRHMGFKETVQLIQSLPAMHKTVFNLYVFDGYNHREIADQLNIKEGTSHWYLNQARELLKQKITAQLSKTARYDQ